VTFIKTGSGPPDLNRCKWGFYGHICSPILSILTMPRSPHATKPVRILPLITQILLKFHVFIFPDLSFAVTAKKKPPLTSRRQVANDRELGHGFGPLKWLHRK
jgi:hypothetical protein